MKPKHLPRLWCALQGLLPLEAERGAPRETRFRLPVPTEPPGTSCRRIRVAAARWTVKVSPRVTP